MILLKRKLIEDVLFQLEAAQKDKWVQSTQNVIDEINTFVRKSEYNSLRDLLLSFHDSLESGFPINGFSKHRNVDRFLNKFE